MNTKSSFMSQLQMKMGKFATGMNRNMYVTAIRDAMLAYVPFTFIASVFLIFAAFPIEGFNSFISNLIHVETEVWQAKLLIVCNASLSIGGLLVVLTSSYSIADKMKLNHIQVVLTALVSYLVLTPLVSLKDGSAVLKLSSVSAQSMFVAILVGIFTAIIYRFVDRKGFKIKMPASVPPAVSAPFEALIPSFVVISIFWLIRLVLDGVGTDAVSLINGTLGIPLKLFGGSVIGLVFIMTFQQILWFFGLHGSSIVSGVMTPIWQVLEDQIRVASLAGELPTNIISSSFVTHFATIGLQGAIIAALIAARSRQYREVAKISSAPMAFNIGEPALFGFPLMLNFTTLIPFVFACSINVIVAYVAFAIGLVPIPTGLVQLPWTTPIIVSGFLVTNSWRGAALQLVLVIVSTLVWMPFIKMGDKQNLKVEQASTQDAQEK